ncbi:thiamine phosphate synthase [Flavobacterium cellulosilyticum]|uniref:Thiamine phosphate synthase n=1 Tax=Flavobacterium cellulosilyticum TaxID=2541731 RepID=A0A4R5CH62_9FLAO|nr:thiamine phosphate synthase [Flavobacterium cellulosilyticum]TDD96622.1 thiamine phosphate synthase [Flavobacterium cellulosilyticum]
MIVITNPTAIVNEIDTIHALFENGLELLHIRKPDFTVAEMVAFVNSIGLDFRYKLVLHSHPQLADELGVSRLHFTEKSREIINLETLYFYNQKGFRLSTSTHSIEDFNKLNAIFEYAFLSPVFPSISKVGHQSNIDLFEAIKYRTNFATQLVGLGGISPKNSKTTIAQGFDKVAVLGAIWNNANPIENFKLCQ